MFKKLLAGYKSLPPEIRIVLAMAGLGSPYGAFELLRLIFPGASTRQLIFGVAGVMFLLAGLSFLAVKLFGWKKNKKANKLGGDLARQDASGPVSMDVRAAIKSNNEKFFTAIREMKKNLNVNVYDLPWYIVIGDSGCGKTKLINEGGLTFSTGKPEGYQLGTLNYNWWFTEDAIFVDMAGRLCNPQDDADHKEWQAFLETVSKGRKGYPINGAIVAVSAEHLLQDSPEKHEQDANTALERLRELQTRLGVTFATYLVVTKCDKILGFMQFFDRAERDISFRNQIFGWSKPGPFNELYDPEKFTDDFDNLYTRLNELRIRRLNDDAEEHELGMAYSFPEEFRELREPLQTYTRTLFPMIKQARVVKNLIFRGVYFTTATQQGSVILKHLAERMGNDSAQNIPTLEELYPKPRAHFIKDLFFRKVFKEFGLVFRNEQEAAKHQKLAKLLRTASIVVTVVVLASLAYGFTKFDSLIGKARAMVIASMNDKGEPGPAPVVAASGVETDALKACIDISKYRQDLIDNPWAARLLSLFWDSGKPVRDLQSIRAGLFEEAVLRPALRQVDDALRAAKIGEYGDSKDHAERAERFRKCLVVYLKLASYRDREGEQPSLEQRDYDSLFSIVKTKSSDKGDVIGLVSWDQFMSELGQYIAQCSQDANLNASSLLKRPGFSPDETLLAALEAYRRYLLPLARMDETHPDDSVKKWMLVKKSCSDIESAYANILVLSDTEVESRKDLEALREEYAKLHTRLAGAFDNCRWEESKGDLGQRGEPLETLAAALSRVREKHWVSAQRDFHFAFTGRDLSGTRASSDATNASSSAQESATGSAAKDTSERQKILRSIGMIASPPVGAPEEDSCLDRIVKRGLGELGLLNTANIKEGATLAELVLEIPALYPGILDPIRSGDNDPARVFGLKLTPDAETVRAKLDQMNATLAKLATASETEASRAALRACIDKVIDAGNAVIDLQEKPVVVELQGDHKQFWKPEELAQLMTSQASLVARAQMTDALAITSASLGNCTKSEWGLAELVDGYEKPIKSQYVIAKPKLTDRTAVADDSARKTTERKPGKRRFGRDRSNDRREPADMEPVEAPAEDSSDAVPRCATRAFLAGIALEVYDLKGVLQDVRQGDYLPEGDEDLVKRCRSAVSKAEEKYFDTYFAMWKGAYDRAGLRFASRVKGNKDWGSIRNDVRSFRQNIKDELEGLIASLFENVVWPERGLTMSGDDAHLLREARNKSWKETRFVAAIMDAPERGAEKPWNDMARDIGKGWDAFAAAVGSYEDLPSDYSNEMLPPVKPMVWRIVDEVIQRKLDDLKFMRDMLEIVQDCQNAADGEVHRRLIALQDGFSFKMETLPYESPDFTGKVIDAGKFSLFLRNIRTAKTVLEPLDRDLPNYALRNRLYFACAQWEKFIKPNDKPAFSEPLTITIKYDPSYKSNTHLKRRWIDAANASEWKGNKPDTNPPNMFDDAQFLIGLRPDTETGGEMIAVSVEGSQGVRCKWDWPTGSTTYSKAKIQLHASGERSNVNVKDMSSAELGQVDRLLLPAVLEQMGFPEDNERTEWSIALGWDLLRMYEARGDSLSAGEIRSLKPEDRVVGTMFVLKLDRKLPPAIECLKPAPSTSSAQ